MRSLRRSIGSKGRAFLFDTTSRSIFPSTDRYNFSSSFSPSRSAPFMHFFRCMHAIEAFRKGKELVRGQRVLKQGDLNELLRGQRVLKQGDTVDLLDLLFTKDRDYLIKCNGSQQIKAEQLRDKVVVIYFDSLSKIERQCLISLTHVYSALHPKYPFEVVFVDTDDFETHTGKPFINVFLNMPWTAIPLSDVTSRKHLKQIFGVVGEAYLGNTSIINPSGTIAQWNQEGIFSKYGAGGYPFDSATIDFLKSQDEKAIRKPTLKALLGNSERDYLISNKGDKVAIDTLEDKVVALFFYTECKLHQELTARLKVAYEELPREKFEVVLIYLYEKPPSFYSTSEEEFSDTFKTMPWLALPFKDLNCKKLERIFFVSWVDEMLDYGLVIIGPHMKFIQPFGLDILWAHNSRAYPFTCERVADLVAEEAKKLKLEMLWETDSIFGGQFGSQVERSLFAGKRVIILFHWCLVREEDSVKFIETLKEKYETLRNTDKKFEVIYVTTKSAGNEHVKNHCWVTVHDYRDKTGIFRVCGNYYHKCPSLLAFEEDGKIVRKTIYPTLEEKYFPFYSGSLEKEALSQLVTMFDWDWLEEGYPGTIYAYNKNRNRGVFSKLLEMLGLN